MIDSPLSVANFRHVFAVFVDVILVVQKLVAEKLLDVSGLPAGIHLSQIFRGQRSGQRFIQRFPPS